MPQEITSSVYDEFSIGNLRLKNRIVLGPIDTKFDYFNNEEFEHISDFLDSATKDCGAALVILPNAVVHFTGKPTSSDHVASFRYLKQVEKLSKVIHLNNSKVLLQLVHAGAAADHPFALAASKFKNQRTGRTAHAVSNFLIKRITASYAKIAKNAMEFAGVDGIEILGSEMSLPNTFTSLVFNKRSDTFGGKSRLKFALNLVRNIRANIPDSAIISYRLSLMDLSDKGMTWTELVDFARALVKAGVNHFSFDIGLGNSRFPIEESQTPENIWTGYMSDFAQATKAPISFSKKLSISGFIDDLALMCENSLFEYTIPFLADPQFANKVKHHKTSSIHYSMYSTDIYTDNNGKLFCPLNPLLTIKLPEITTNKKNYLIVGAGPSGIGFAFGARIKGHNVTLVDENPVVGGLFVHSKDVPGFASRENFSIFWKEKLEEIGVKLILSTKVDEKWISEQASYHDIVLACGVSPVIPDIVGIDSPNVLTYEDVLLDHVPVGKRIAILGDTLIGRALALRLAAEKTLTGQDWLNAWGIGSPKEYKGGTFGVIPIMPEPEREVLLLSDKDWEIGHDINKSSKSYEMQWLRMNGVQTLNKVNYESIDSYALRISSASSEEHHAPIKLDHIILAGEFKANDTLRNELQEANMSFIEIGTMTTPNRSKNASKLLLEAVRIGINQ